jgi:hypothetical protein
MRTLALVPLLAAACSAPVGPTYYKDVKPLVEQHCSTCHVDGGIAPFALSNYLALIDHKDDVRKAVSTRLMPPWQPAKGCSDYQGDFSLDDATIKVFTDWVDAGAQMGNPADYVAPVIPQKQGLSRTDATLSLPVPYTPQLSPDDYRCFLIDWPRTATSYVSGFRANPNQPTIVHHVIAFAAPPAQVATYQALDDADPLPGYTCFGGPGAGGQQALWLGSWAPGSQGADFPPNTGIRVEPGSKVILQVHYNTSVAAPIPDQTTIEFKIDDTVAKEAILQPWTNPSWLRGQTMDIPAGDADATHSWDVNAIPLLTFATNGLVDGTAPITLYTGALHMHTRGTRALLEIHHPDGSKDCMLEIDRWNFHWQGAYAFTQPKTLNPTDNLYLECHWDNSIGTTTLYWGEGTADEMCLGAFYLTK